MIADSDLPVGVNGLTGASLVWGTRCWADLVAGGSESSCHLQGVTTALLCPRHHAEIVGPAAVVAA